MSSGVGRQLCAAGAGAQGACARQEQVLPGWGRGYHLQTLGIWYFSGKSLAGPQSRGGSEGSLEGTACPVTTAPGGSIRGASITQKSPQDEFFH